MQLIWIDRMIRLHRLERLGNLLSEYCFARVLARRFNYSLEACPTPEFPGSYRRIEGKEVFGPEVMWTGHWPGEAYSSRKLERAELFEAPGARVTRCGFFQRFEYIADIREEVREDWLRMDDPLPVRASGDFVICLRLGDVYSTADQTGDGGRETSSFSDDLALSFPASDSGTSQSKCR